MRGLPNTPEDMKPGVEGGGSILIPRLLVVGHDLGMHDVSYVVALQCILMPWSSCVKVISSPEGEKRRRMSLRKGGGE